MIEVTINFGHTQLVTFLSHVPTRGEYIELSSGANVGLFQVDTVTTQLTTTPDPTVQLQNPRIVIDTFQAKMNRFFDEHPQEDVT